jgi:hypothetical protein
MTKYQIVFTEMTNENKDLFVKFKDIHDKYAENDIKYQAEFNQIGETVMEVIRKYENRLCGRTEGGKYGKFSSNLSDKFRAMVRVVFPKIDYIGITIS